MSRTKVVIILPTRSERQFQAELIKFAHLCGWRVAHFRPARLLDRDGKEQWRTPVAADGAGWPDLVLNKTLLDGNTVVVAAELKSEKGKLTPPQRDWLERLVKVTGIYVFVWIPLQWVEIAATLQAKGLPDIINAWKKHALFARSHFGLSLVTPEKE